MAIGSGEPVADHNRCDRAQADLLEATTSPWQVRTVCQRPTIVTLDDKKIVRIVVMPGGAAASQVNSGSQTD